MIGQWTYEWLKNQSFEVTFLDETTSTNLIAKDNAMTEKTPVVYYVADSQTQGRGQGTNKWINTKPGSNLLVTCSIESKNPPQPELCLSFGEHLKKACQSRWPNLGWRVKPPNDIYIDDKKIAGILLETVSQGTKHRLLIGLGFNVTEHPVDDSFLATNLNAHISEVKKSDWQHFLKEVFQQIQEDLLLK